MRKPSPALSALAAAASFLAASGCGGRLEVATVLTDLYDPAMGVNPGAWYYDFDPPSAMSGTGWGDVESDGVERKSWVVAPDARVSFKLTPVEEIYSVCVGYAAFFVPQLRAVDQDVAVELNGQPLVTFRTHGARKPGYLDWCTSAPASAFKSGDNTLVLRPSSFTSPQSFGLSEDGRPLSIMVDYFSVFPARLGKLTTPLAARIAAGPALGQPRLNAEALQLGSGGVVRLPLAVPPGGLLELGLPAGFVERGGVLQLEFAPKDQPVIWKETVSPASRPVRSLYGVNFYRISLSAIERTAGALTLRYAPDHANQPTSALIVSPLILKPRGAGAT